MSVTAGLSIGESLAEMTVRVPDQPPTRARWTFARKSLSEGIRDAFAAAGVDPSVSAGSFAVASWAGEATIARRLGTPCAFVGTSGFEQAPAIAVSSLAGGDLTFPIARDSTFAAAERTRADGSVSAALDVAEIARIGAKIKLLSPSRPVALGFLHSVVRPEHEEQAKAALRDAGVSFVAASHSFASPSGAEGEAQRPSEAEGEAQNLSEAEGEAQNLSEAEGEAQRWWRAILACYAHAALADEERDVRASLGDAWTVRWLGGGSAPCPRLENAFGLEEALAKGAGRSTILHFGLERFFAASAQPLRLRDGFPWFRSLRAEPASTRAFTLQPLARISTDAGSVPQFLFETRGYEPGPMALGKSLQLTALDVLAWRGRPFETDGGPTISLARATPRIAEALITLARAADPSLQRPDPAALGEDLESLMAESFVADLVAAGAEGPFVATGPLAPAIGPLIARRRPDWQIDFAGKDATALGGAWAASEALARAAEEIA